MEKLNPVLAWAFAHRREIGLRVEEITLTSQWLSEFSDYKVILEFDGLHEGRGTTRSAYKALEIAFTEAFEQRIVRKSGLCSGNGVAAHPCLQKARELARKELIERDLFLCHYLTQVPLTPLLVQVPFQKRLDAACVFLRVFKTRSVMDIEVVVSIADGSRAKPAPFGAIIGLGADEDVGQAAQKACIECLRNVIFLLGRDRHPELSAAELKRLPKPKAKDQLHWSFCPASTAGISSIVDSSFAPSFTAGKEKLPGSYEYHLLHSRDEKGSTPPLFVVQCVNPMLQNLFFGYSTQDKLNMQRLSRFCGRTVEMKDINLHPHPLG